MLPLPVLAQLTDAPTWVLVIGIGQLLSLGVAAMQFIQMSNGRGKERQVEPTAVSSLASEIRDQGTKIDGQTSALSTLNREIGSLAAAVTSISDSVDNLAKTQREDISGAHRRIDELSKEVARHQAEISAIQRNCEKCN